MASPWEEAAIAVKSGKMPWDEAFSGALPWEEAAGVVDKNSIAATEKQFNEKAIQKPQGGAVSRGAGGLWDTTIGGLGQAAKTIYRLATPQPGGIPNPEAMADVAGMVSAHEDQARKAKESWNKPGFGNKVEAVGHGMAAALPLVGPAAAHAGERIGGTAPQFDRFGNVLTPGQAPDVAGGVGEGVGLAVAVSPKNITKPALRGAGNVIGKIPVPERITPKGMYQGSLRPSLSQKNLPKIDAEVETGLRERIPVDRKGLAKTDAAIDSINSEIVDRLTGKSNELGPVVSPRSVASRVNQVRPTFAEQVNPSSDLASLDRSTAEFLSKHSEDAPYTKIAPMVEEGSGFSKVGEGVTKVEKPLTLSEAQAEKQGTYRQLRKKYGELGSADVEAQKSLARGLKEEIVKRVPELADLNAREGSLIDLQTQLEKMVAREGNKNVLGLVPATMAHNPYGFIATLLMDNPAIKSRIAIALDRAHKVGKRANFSGAAAIAPTAVIGSPAIPRYAKGGIIRRPTILMDAKTHKPTGIMAEKGPEAIVPIGTPDDPSAAPISAHAAAAQLGSKWRIKFPHRRKQ